MRGRWSIRGVRGCPPTVPATLFSPNGIAMSTTFSITSGATSLCEDGAIERAREVHFCGVSLGVVQDARSRSLMRGCLCCKEIRPTALDHHHVFLIAPSRLDRRPDRREAGIRLVLAPLGSAHRRGLFCKTCSHIRMHTAFSRSIPHASLISSLSSSGSHSSLLLPSSRPLLHHRASPIPGEYLIPGECRYTMTRPGAPSPHDARAFRRHA
jgi:hypothetical protein